MDRDTPGSRLLAEGPDAVLKYLDKVLDSVEGPSIPSYNDCSEMFDYEDKLPLKIILKICSKALAELSIVSKDRYYYDYTENKPFTARMEMKFLANLITSNITKLTRNQNIEQDGFGYLRDEFLVFGDGEQSDYLVKAYEPWHPVEVQLTSHNSTILYVWGVFNSKTNELFNKYILEKREQEKELIYVFDIVSKEEDRDPLYIYGTKLPIDVYYSTKLVLIHMLNGKGTLAQYEFDDTEYLMIVIRDEDVADIWVKQAAHNKIMDEKNSDL